MTGWGAGLLRMDGGRRLPAGCDRPIHQRRVLHRLIQRLVFSRCLKRADVILVTRRIDDKTLETMFARRADSVDQAVGMALARQGEDAGIVRMRTDPT